MRRMLQSLLFVALMAGVQFNVLQAKQLYADKLLLLKFERKLYLMLDEKRVASYPVSLGSNPIGDKQKQGDSRTPEGIYKIDYRNPQSRFYLSLHISYPDKSDILRARRNGVKPGGDIFIHGLPGGVTDASYRFYSHDWTDRCIAVSNKAIREIWSMVRNGTPIEIRP